LPSCPLLHQQLVAIRYEPGMDRDPTILLDLSATQNVANVALPLPSALSGILVQFAIISHFGPSRDGCASNSSSVPSPPLNISDFSSETSDVAAAAGIEAYAGSTSITVVLKSVPAMSFVAIYSSAQPSLSMCKPSSNSIKVAITDEVVCVDCFFKKASQIVSFERLPSYAGWVVALCVPVSFPPSPCTHPQPPLKTAATVYLNTSSASLYGIPEITEAKATQRGLRVCWRHSTSPASSWILTMRFNTNATAHPNISFTRTPSELSANDCMIGRSCAACSEFPLDVTSFCANQNNWNAAITVTLFSELFGQHLSSSAFPFFSLCTPPPPSLATCLIAQTAGSLGALVNVSWRPQPAHVTRLLVTVYDLADSRPVATVHNVSAAVLPNYLLLPLPEGSSCCLTARSATQSNVFSEPTTPICGLQVKFFRISRSHPLETHFIFIS
jgi:hypothetical protein